VKEDPLSKKGSHSHHVLRKLLVRGRAEVQKSKLNLVKIRAEERIDLGQVSFLSSFASKSELTGEDTTEPRTCGRKLIDHDVSGEHSDNLGQQKILVHKITELNCEDSACSFTVRLKVVFEVKAEACDSHANLRLRNPLVQIESLD